MKIVKNVKTRGVEPFEDKGWRKSAVIRQFLKKGKFWTSGVTFLNRTKSLFIHFLIWRDQEGTQTQGPLAHHIQLQNQQIIYLWLTFRLCFELLKTGLFSNEHGLKFGDEASFMSHKFLENFQ